MKYIKLFEDFDDNELERPEFLKDINQKIIKTEYDKYIRYAETVDFIYFLNRNDGEDCLMYRKSDLKLVSDNYFGFNDLYENLMGGKCTWLSKHAKFDYEENKDNYEE